MNRSMRGFVMGAALIFASSVPAWATPFTVSIKPIHIRNDAGAGCGNAAERLFEAEGDKIWAQAGIDLVFLPWAQINETDFLDVTVGNNAVIDPEAQAVMTTGDRDQQHRAHLGDPASSSPTLDHDPGLFGLGCGGPVFAAFCNNQVGVFIADNVFSFNGGIGRLDTIAHELGHVLNLQHTANANELMASGGVRDIPGTINDIVPDGAQLDLLTQPQITKALKSRYVTVTVVPESAAFTLLAIGIGLLGVAARPRKSA